MKVRVKKTGEVFLAMEFTRVYVETYDSMGETRSYRLDEIEIIPDEPHKVEAPAIDWEQRRYEIAKDVMSALVAYIVPNSKGAFSYQFEAQVVIQCADELIKQLKAQ